MISLPSPFRIEDADAWIAHVRDGTKVDGYLIVEEGEGAIIGAAELRDFDREHRQAESSFWLDPHFWGRGYASDALRQLAAIAFHQHGLNRIFAYHMARNPASGRVLEKCGFHFEGCLRQRVWKKGQSEDAMLWSRLAGDPSPAPRKSDEVIVRRGPTLGAGSLP
jgi:RimJ/RimL family protein N-acetyltransferase